MQNEPMWMLIVYMTLLELSHFVMANWDRTCTPFSKSFGPHPGGICGRRIDETLKLLCFDGYNDSPYSRKKRDTQDNSVEAQLSGLGSVLIPREEANSYLVKRSNYFERGIVCECCYHRCGLNELFSYCRNGPGLFGLFKRSVDSKLRTLNNKIKQSNKTDSHLSSNRHKRISPYDEE